MPPVDGHTGLTDSSLRKLAAASDWRQRAIAAGDSACPQDVLADLLEDQSWRVVGEAIKNRSCPADMRIQAMYQIANSDSAAARENLASLWGNRKTDPIAIIEKLLEDKQWGIVKAALKNPACPPEARAKTMRRVAAFGSQAVKKELIGLWGNYNTDPIDVIRGLAADSNPALRIAVARNNACPDAVLEELTADPTAKVRKAAVGNMQHPLNVRNILTNSQKSAWLQAKLLDAEKKTPGITAAVAHGDYLFPAPRTDKAAQGASLLGRIIALSQHDANPKLLARSSGYRDWRLRMTIARNPNTPAHILNKLARDSHRVVAAMAKATIQGKSETRSRIYRQAAKLKAEASADLDLARLDRWIGEWLRDAALEEEKKHFTRKVWRLPVKDIDNAIDARVADRLGGPLGPWGAWLPLSSWWNPTNLAPSLIQEHWQKGLGKAAPDLTDLLKQSPAKDERNLLHLIARSENCPEKLFNEFYSGEDTVLKEAIAGNGACPAALLTELGKFRSLKIKWALAKNPNCPQRIIEDLASSSYGAFALTERRKKLPLDVWKTMARSKDERVRQDVAESKKCPLEILELLAQDPDRVVRVHIAENSHTPAYLLEKLANDWDSWVRVHVAENPHTPDSLVENLANDEWEQVRSAAARNSSKLATETLMRLAKDKSKEVRKYLVRERDIPLEVLKLLAKDKEGEVRAFVAARQKTTVEMLELLSKDRDAEVRENVAGHERATAKILEQLAKDRDARVLIAVAKHPQTPVHCLKVLVKSKTQPWGSRWRGTAASNAVQNPKCPADALEQFYESHRRPDSIGYRDILDSGILGLLRHKKCPLSLIERIAAEDESAKYRKLAREALKRRK